MVYTTNFSNPWLQSFENTQQVVKGALKFS